MIIKYFIIGQLLLCSAFASTNLKDTNTAPTMCAPSLHNNEIQLNFTNLSSLEIGKNLDVIYTSISQGMNNLNLIQKAGANFTILANLNFHMLYNNKQELWHVSSLNIQNLIIYGETFIIRQADTPQDLYNRLLVSKTAKTVLNANKNFLYGASLYVPHNNVHTGELIFTLGNTFNLNTQNPERPTISKGEWTLFFNCVVTPFLDKFFK